jgi:hypothetical protein
MNQITATKSSSTRPANHRMAASAMSWRPLRAFEHPTTRPTKPIDTFADQAAVVHRQSWQGSHLEITEGSKMTNNKLSQLVGVHDILGNDFEHLARAFELRAEHLRPDLGEWDFCDPFSHRLLDVIEAQCFLADAICNSVDYGGQSAEAEIEAAYRRRRDAVQRLVRSLDQR